MIKKKVYIVYTGGTIGMKKTRQGYVPVAGYLQEQLMAIPVLSSPEMPDFDIHEYQPLLDSANMGPNDWFNIAQDIEKNYAVYDGFIVLHGTDTMAYTASMLSFMLRELSKPVILTGAQIPFCEIRSDGRENIITALLIAAGFQIPEVCLYFGGKLLRGCRATKVDATGLDAFISPNFPPLGTAGIDIEISTDLILRQNYHRSNIDVKPFDESMTMAILRLFPGISMGFIERVLEGSPRAVILETYGVGNAPLKNKGFLNLIESANEKGTIIINCTQCLRGTVKMGDYATGAALAERGVISGYDMTIEATLAKIFYLLSIDLPISLVKDALQKNLRGEVTLPQVSL